MNEEQDRIAKEQSDTPKGYITRRQMLGAMAVGVGGVLAGALNTPLAFAAQSSSPDLGAPQYSNSPVPRVPTQARKNTLIGIGYETWFMPGVNDWAAREATPVLGLYRSDDPSVITQHAAWIVDAGYDFVLIDWSNNLGNNWTNGVASAIMQGTAAVFAQYATLPAHPQISLLIGLDTGGTGVGTANWNAQIAQIKQTYLGNPQYNQMLVRYQGKPLLTVYRGPAGGPPPTWSDPDFTVRWMTAYHEIIGDTAGQWSWIDRIPLISGPRTKVSDFAGGGTVGDTTNNGAFPAMKTGQTYGQSFTVSGYLDRVGGLFATYGSSTSGMTLTLYQGQPGGTLTPVASQTFTNMQDNTWQYMSFALQPPGVYYMEMSNPTGTPTWWYDNGQSGSAVGGAAYVSRQAQANLTVCFQAFMSGAGFKGWSVNSAWTIVQNGNDPFGRTSPTGAFADTRASGSSGSAATGTATSPSFVVSGDFVSFYAAGHDNADNSGKLDYFYLKDALTAQVLYQSHTPGSDLFIPVQWDVRNLMGRSVVFQAVAGNASPASWMAFCGVHQTTAEFAVAVTAAPGNAGWLAYDAQLRESGATLVKFMDGIFKYQPDIALIQQWNEFAQPDQLFVASSNDIEPTVINHIDGENSDGWGDYYLRLVKELIRQYRDGYAYPVVELDQRYP